MNNPTIEDVVQMQKDLDAKLAQFGQDAILPRAQAVLANFPEAEAVTWDQYTPYFNDGDACTFSVGDFWAIKAGGLKEIEEEGLYPEELSIDIDGSHGLSYQECKPLYEAHAKKFAPLAEIPESILEKVFGDHVRVTLKRDETKFTVEEYEHD